MFKSVNRKVKHRTKRSWNVLIAEAQRQLDEARNRVSGLEKTVANFTRLRDEGMPLPGNEKAGKAKEAIPA